MRQFNSSVQFFDLEYCKDTHFSNKTFEVLPLLQGAIWMPLNYSLKGSTFSDTYKGLRLAVLYQPNSYWPLTYEEFVSKVHYFTFTLVIANEYFDPSSKEDPIKTMINDQYNVKISTDRYTHYDVFIKKNTYEIESGNLFISKKTGTFYRTGADK